MHGAGEGARSELGLAPGEQGGDGGRRVDDERRVGVAFDDGTLCGQQRRVHDDGHDADPDGGEGEHDHGGRGRKAHEQALPGHEAGVGERAGDPPLEHLGRACGQRSRVGARSPDHRHSPSLPPGRGGRPSAGAVGAQPKKTSATSW